MALSATVSHLLGNTTREDEGIGRVDKRTKWRQTLTTKPPAAHQHVGGSDLFDRETLDGLEEITVQMVRLEPAFRSREQVMRFFDGTDLVEPGLVRVEEWRPEPAAGTTGRSSLWCAVGRKR